MKITLNSGAVYEKTLEIPYGHSPNPMTIDDVCNKVRDCCSYAKHNISREDIEKVIDMCMNLKKPDNLKVIIDLFS